MKYNTRASQFKHFITFLGKTIGSDGMGSGGEITWTDSGISSMAVIRPIRGNERIEAMKYEHVITHRIIVRYVAGLTADMRVRNEISGTYYDISGGLINREEENMEIEFFAVELTGGL